MLTISHALSVSQAQDYYENEYTNAGLIHAEYYQEQGEGRGQWFGKLAEEMGLIGDVTEEQFYRAIEGKDPKTGEQLIQHIESRTYINKYGQEVKPAEHRAGWDATFSMPKSLVILAYMSSDPGLKKAIWQAHINSVNKALAELEKFACARRGNGKWERSGNIVASLHHHERARPDERTGYAAPEIHTHAVIMNMTQGSDGKVHAMQEIELFRSQVYLTAIYRTLLAEDVQKLGIELRVDLETGAPEAKGISREYIEAASPRGEEVKRKSGEIKERLEAEGHTVKDGAGLRQAAARLNRQGKDFNLEEMIRRDAELEKQFGFQAHRAREAARERGPIIRTREETLRRAKQAVTYGIETAMEREAVNDARLLMAKALQRNMTLTTYDAVKAEMEAREASGELTKIERLEKMPERTTVRMLNLERGNIKAALDGKGTQAPLLSPRQEAKNLIDEISYRQGIGLNWDQDQAVLRLLENRDRIVGLQGRAGVGKTTVLRIFREAAERGGYEVVGIAPTNIASKELEKSGLWSQTLAGFLKSSRKGEGGKRWLVCDESSLADTKRMNILFKRIGPEDRVLFVGDRDQHQAIEAGAPYEQLQNRRMETIWIKEVVRQQEPGYREAVMLLQDGKIREAIGKLQEQGRIVEVSDDKARYAQVAALYVYRPDGNLVVAPGNLERVVINENIHRMQQQAGRVEGKDHLTSILVNREDLTGADRKFAGKYRAGQDIVRYREGSEVYGIKKGEYGRVVGVDFEQNLLAVEFDDERRVTYNPERLYGVEIFKEEERKFAVGDRIQFRRSYERKAVNMELGVIEKIEGKDFSVRLQDGERVEVDTEKFRHFDYGYGVTSYLSQSQTSIREIVHIDTRMSDVVVNERMSKVAVTRGIEDVMIVTDSLEGLVAALERKRDKEIALDALAQSDKLKESRAQTEAGAVAGRAAGTEQQDDLAPEPDDLYEYENHLWDIPDGLPELMHERVILGQAIVAKTWYECAKLDAQVARDYGKAFRLRVHDESTGAERSLSEVDVTARAEARAARLADQQIRGPADLRREIRGQLAGQDIAHHSETLKAHERARAELVKGREEREAQALNDHTKTDERARAVTLKYRSRGEEPPAPYLGRETLDRVENQAIRRGLAERIEIFENLRAALSPEHGQAMRTDSEAARLAAQALTARVEYQARCGAVENFEYTRHLHSWEVGGDWGNGGKRWSLADLDAAIERAGNQSKVWDKFYNWHSDSHSRTRARAEREHLSGIREKVIERIDERGRELAGRAEEARKLADLLNAAYEREAELRSSHGLRMPDPVLTSHELERIEANLPAVRDTNLLRQLPEFKRASDKVDDLGRALGRAYVTEIKCREAGERLRNFERHGERTPLLIESPDGHFSMRRLQDVKLYTPIDRVFEKKEERARREVVEAAFDKHHRRLVEEYEKSLAYFQVAQAQASRLRSETGKTGLDLSIIELTPGEKAALERFAEKRADEQERNHYLRIALESTQYKTQQERARASVTRSPGIENASHSPERERAEREQGQQRSAGNLPDADEIRVGVARELAESGRLAEAKLIVRHLDEREAQPLVERRLERLSAEGRSKHDTFSDRGEAAKIVRELAQVGLLPEGEAKSILRMLNDERGRVEQKAKKQELPSSKHERRPPSQERAWAQDVAETGAAQTNSLRLKSDVPVTTVRPERKASQTPHTFKRTVTKKDFPEWEKPAQQKLVRVRRKDPCPICKKGDWCSVSTDRAIAICMRVSSDHRAKNGGFVHILDGRIQSRQPIPVTVEVKQYERADIDRRHQVNQELLRALKVKARDLKNLLARGLDKAAIERNGYRSVPTPHELDEVMKNFEGKDLRGIPGFFRQGERWRLNIGEWTSKKDGITHSYHQGFLVPVRDVQGRIEGFQVRRAEVRDGDDLRYIWLSSSSKEDGASSGAPVHFRNVEQARKSGQAILTEGALKADSAAHLLENRHAMIAVAGVNTFPDDFGHRLRAQIPELRQVVIAFDADVGRKVEVQQALERLHESLKAAGLGLRELRWEEKQGKGLDDYLFKDADHKTKVHSFLQESLESLKRGNDRTMTSDNHHANQEQSREQGRQRRPSGFSISK
jgi:conjugative relaxase-like TrwC/TraI family protein